MSTPYLASVPLPEFSLWKKIHNKSSLVGFDLEITACCNNNCRHCYINLPAGLPFWIPEQAFGS